MYIVHVRIYLSFFLSLSIYIYMYVYMCAHVMGHSRVHGPDDAIGCPLSRSMHQRSSFAGIPIHGSVQVCWPVPIFFIEVCADTIQVRTQCFPNRR